MAALTGDAMAADPFELFDAWFAEAKVAEINDPEAMALATSTPDGHPSVRIVLLKGHGPQGFDFYTNLDSRKGAELDADPRAALLFHWKSLRRQVRVEGPVELLPAEESDMYFASRGRDSQIGAWASDQSRPLQSREAFERRCEEVRRRYEGREVPRPERWGGFRVKPETFEFWSDRPHRLHERRLFTRTANGWGEGLLYP
jgi:pyridoxamine 5'-phosphate oxidase